MIKYVRSSIPSLFTLMNLFSGFVSIKTSMIDQDFVAAGWFIGLGGIFDMMDGMMARLTKSSSEFGIELDSLADVVTFGVAPSALVYRLFFYQFPGYGLLLAALPALLGAVRLARFNVQLVGFDKDYFRGLPIPSAAILIISYVIYHHLTLPAAERLTDNWMFIVVIGAALMMVSTVKYDTIPKLSRRGIAAHPFKFGAFLAGIILVIATRGSAMFPVFVIFVLFGIVRSFVDRATRFLRERRASALLDEDLLEQEEESTFGM
jgi:CDP-diacylglycerol--serine O-phosphatidyltransferase